MTKMTNLEIIRAGWDMGWSATVDYDFQVISFNPVLTFLHRGKVEYDATKLEDVKITGWLYAGELAGKGEIPEGQRFRVKETGKIFIGEAINSDIIANKHLLKHYIKSEIEPVFNHNPN